MRLECHELENKLYCKKEEKEEEELKLRKRILIFGNLCDELQNLLRNLYGEISEYTKEISIYLNDWIKYAKDFVEKLYKLPKDYLNQIRISIVDDIPPPFPGTKVLGAYEYVKDNFGRILSQTILISKDALKDYSTFFKTLVHEFTHAAQNYYGRLKQRIYESFEKYFLDPIEEEARDVAERAWNSFVKYLKDIGGRILNYIGRGNSNYAARMYFL